MKMNRRGFFKFLPGLGVGVAALGLANKKSLARETPLVVSNQANADFYREYVRQNRFRGYTMSEALDVQKEVNRRRSEQIARMK